MSNLIQIKQSTKYPELFVHKYKKKVFYDNLWYTDSALLEARGHVYTANGKLVINPPTKVFNRNENGTNIDLNEDCLVVEKMNGFMACLTWVEEVNDVVISTTGSLDSDYVQMARNMMPRAIEYVKEQKVPTTFFFEVCHPDNPHIIPENIGVYLLGARPIENKNYYFSDWDTEEHLDWVASMMHVSRPIYYHMSFEAVLEWLSECKHEGYMVYGQKSGTVLKLKSPYYLTCKAIARKKDILSLNKKYVDEEYYPLLDHLKTINEQFNQLDEQAKLLYIKHYLENN